MHVFTPDPDILYATSVVDPGSEQDNLYQQWMRAIHDYSNTHQSNQLPPAYFFWVVLRVPAKNYSELIEDHETIPMMVPKEGCGELVGFARDKAELDAMTTPALDAKAGKVREGDNKGNYVYLTYRVRVQGEQHWRELVEYFANKGMIEREA